MSASSYRHQQRQQQQQQQQRQRQRRPWEKGVSSLPDPPHFQCHRHKRDTFPSRHSNEKRHKNSKENENGGSNVPYVTINGMHYYSDRFYLNSTTFNNDCKNESTNTKCCCQKQKQQQAPPQSHTNKTSSSSQPPLFDRSKLISSLDLIGVVAATYTLDAKWIVKEFPSLFGAGAESGDEKRKRKGKGNVPTLILHGHKGLQIPTPKPLLSTSSPSSSTLDKNISNFNSDPRHNNSNDSTQKQRQLQHNKESSAVAFRNEQQKSIEIISIDDTDDDNDDDTDHTSETNKIPKCKNPISIAKEQEQEQKHNSKTITLEKGELPSSSFATQKQMSIKKPIQTTNTQNTTLIAKTDQKIDNVQQKSMPAATTRIVKRKRGSCSNYSNRGRRNTNKKVMMIMNPIVYDAEDAQTTDDDGGDDDSNGDIKEEEDQEEGGIIKKEEISSWSSSSLVLPDPSTSTSTKIKQNTNLRLDTNNKNDDINDYNSKTRQEKIQHWFGNDVYLTKILPTWLPPPSSLVSGGKEDKKRNDLAGENGNVHCKKQQQQERRKIRNDCDKKVDCNDLIVIDSSDDDDGNREHKDARSQEETQQQQQQRQQQRKAVQGGVHHPKYLLLFEKSGSIVVVVSTSNLTKPFGCVDASWVQRFEPRHRSSYSKESKYYENDGDSESSRHCSGADGDCSDFGHVLVDFLKCQSGAAEFNAEMLPDDFLRRYIGIPSLEELRRWYKFEDASVHLVSTVPGRHLGRFGLNNLELRRGSGKMVGAEKQRRQYQRHHRQILYGPQRVSDILTKLTGDQSQRDKGKIRDSNHDKNADQNMADSKGRSSRPWLPNGFLSDKDKLIIQTTSLGGNWTQQDLVRVAQSYMGKGKNEQQKSKIRRSSTLPDEEGKNLINSVDIIWPSMDYVKEVGKRCVLEMQQDKKAKADDDNNIDGDLNNVGSMGHSSFLSSTTFNTIDLSCISRMALYDTSGRPDQIPWTLSPHIKTFGRLLLGNKELCYSSEDKLEHSAGTEEGSKETRQQHLAWIMLTSACLSCGAQGKAVKDRCYKSDEMSYSNFELGVLFCSRVQGLPSSDRIYGWDPDHCVVCKPNKQTQASVGDSKGMQWHRGRSVVQRDKGTRLVHLPIPYNLRPPMYQEDEDDADMWATPYFHEIPDGTGCVGQMKLTPLGKMLASESNG